MRPARASSIRQPHADQIMRGTKRIEYRTVATNIRERVYVCAGRQPVHGHEIGKLPTQVIVGTVEIVDCVEKNGEFHWKRAHPQRLARPIKPNRQPQPVWFSPF